MADDKKKDDRKKDERRADEKRERSVEAGGIPSVLSGIVVAVLLLIALGAYFASKIEKSPASPRAGAAASASEMCVPAPAHFTELRFENTRCIVVTLGPEYSGWIVTPERTSYEWNFIGQGEAHLLFQDGLRAYVTHEVKTDVGTRRGIFKAKGAGHLVVKVL